MRDRHHHNIKWIKVKLTDKVLGSAETLVKKRHLEIEIPKKNGKLYLVDMFGHTVYFDTWENLSDEEIHPVTVKVDKTKFHVYKYKGKRHIRKIT